MLCSYGCGQEAKFQTKAGKNICAKSPNSCPVNRGLNAKKTAETYAAGRVSVFRTLPIDKSRKNWRKGKIEKPEFIWGGKGNHKSYLIKIRGHKCECCKNSEWMNTPITLELEHVDGHKQNNNEDNLKLLCPNCHSLTPTWRRKKSALVGKLEKSPDLDSGEFAGSSPA